MPIQCPVQLRVLSAEEFEERDHRVMRLALYQEALIHFAGGEGRVAGRLSLARDGISLAEQGFLLHSQAAAFRVTAMTEATQAQESNLRRLLALTNLHAIQWINLNHFEVQFVTLLGGDKGMETRE